MKFARIAAIAIAAQPLWRLGLAGDHRVRPRGQRIAKIRGYIEPERMQAPQKNSFPGVTEP
jgi:hypothetical protein